MDIPNKVKLKANNALKNEDFAPDPSYKFDMSEGAAEAMDAFYNNLSDEKKDIYEELRAFGNSFNKKIKAQIADYKEVLKEEIKEGSVTPEQLALEFFIRHHDNTIAETYEQVADNLMKKIGFSPKQAHAWKNSTYRSLLRTSQRLMK